jgi:hypothetical protein
MSGCEATFGDRFCEVCEKSVTPTFSTRLIQGQCRDWVEETEKCPGYGAILRHSQIRTDRLRMMQRW